jgi:hypothetical protein
MATSGRTNLAVSTELLLAVQPCRYHLELGLLNDSWKLEDGTSIWDGATVQILQRLMLSENNAILQ